MSEQISQPSSRKPGSAFLGFGLAIMLASAAFFSGLQIGSDATPTEGMEAGLFSFFLSPDRPAEDVSLDEFWRVWHTLEEKFVSTASSSEASEENRLFGAIDGLVDSYGDPYTVFMPPADAEQFGEDISGNFGGVGMEVGLRDGVITIISPLPDTPAEAAGLLAGDLIIQIDGVSTKDMNIDEAVRLIRGEVGTDVVINIYREGTTDFQDITVTRNIISIPTLETEVIGDVFVIRLYNFNALSEAKTKEALREYVRSGHTKLVFDLRGNPGGYLQSAVSIAGYFLPAGKVVVREHFGEQREDEVYRSAGKVIQEFTPDDFVVLTNGGSASASEILAGALKEHEVATVIGERTFGKGSVQELVDLPSGSSLKVTVARWLTPEGVSFSEGGLEPTVTIPRTPQQAMDDIDPQQEAALKWLSGDHDIEIIATSTEPIL